VRQRSVSSIGVVVVGLVPAMLGGLGFALAFSALAAVAFVELATMLRLNSPLAREVGCGLIALAGLLALIVPANRGLPVLVAATVFLPLVVAVFSDGAGSVEEWPRTVAASLYLAVPTFAAVSVRQLQGESAGWLERVGSIDLPAGSGTENGLGWLLLALLTTWLSDTGAYLVGKTFGRRKLIPRISPNKTVEGAIGGIASAALTAMLCAWLFGLPVQVWLALSLGIILGAVGILGDLAESAIKRQAGVKDSGTLIPGHGGVLDRIDALLFVLVTTWLLIPILA